MSTDMKAAHIQSSMGHMQGFGGRKRKGGMGKMMRNQGPDFGGGMDDDIRMMGGFGGMGGGGGMSTGTGLSNKVMEQVENVEKESTQMVCGCNHGLMIEAMKKFMFIQ